MCCVFLYNQFSGNLCGSRELSPKEVLPLTLYGMLCFGISWLALCIYSKWFRSTHHRMDYVNKHIPSIFMGGKLIYILLRLPKGNV